MVIVILVGSTSSKIETENTINTLKSYEVISNKRGVPVIVNYKENSADTPRGVVDQDIQTTIIMLSAIFSGNNRELDTADLNNFVDYTKVTSYSPKLSMLDFFTKDIILNKGQSLVSLVTLIDDKTSSDVHIPVEYQTVGFLPDATKDAVGVELPIHACIIAGYFNNTIDKLDSKLKQYEEVRSIVNEKSIVKEGTASTKEGLVL